MFLVHREQRTSWSRLVRTIRNRPNRMRRATRSPNRTHSPLVEQGMKRRHLIAAGIVVAVVTLCVSLWVNEGPLWRWVITKKVRSESLLPEWHNNHGWISVKRWTKHTVFHGRTVLYYPSNPQVRFPGRPRIKYMEAYFRDGLGMKRTIWRHSGIVDSQQRVLVEKLAFTPGEIPYPADAAGLSAAFRVRDSGAFELKNSPPWWWGVTDQPDPERQIRREVLASKSQAPSAETPPSGRYPPGGTTVPAASRSSHRPALI